MDVKFDFSILPLHRDFDNSIAYFLDSYKGSFASEINDDLRTLPFETLPRERQIYAHFLDKLIRESPRSDKEIYLYRGIHDMSSLSVYFDREKPLYSILSFLKSLIGECILFPEFLSTTYNPKIACEFAQADYEEYNIVLKLKLPGNYPILAVDEAINVLNEFDRIQMLEEGEDEIILPRNSVFRVVSVKTQECFNNKKVYLVTMDASCPQLKPERMPKLTKKDTLYLQKLMKGKRPI
jgi:hypothetical protein